MDFTAAGAQDATARGEFAYVNCADTLLAQIVPTLPFSTVVGVGDKCLPHFIVEAIYARLLGLMPVSRSI